MKRIILLMFLSFLACGELVAANEISREVKIKVVILIIRLCTCYIRNY